MLAAKKTSLQFLGSAEQRKLVKKIRSPPAPRRARGEEISLLSQFQYSGTALEDRGREEKAISQGMNERGAGGLLL